jgi:hypothetical protein
MSREVLRKYQFLNNKFFEEILKNFYKDRSIFLKSFQVRGLVKGEENLWNDEISFVVNFTDQKNILR